MYFCENLCRIIYRNNSKNQCLELQLSILENIFPSCFWLATPCSVVTKVSVCRLLEAQPLHISSSSLVFDDWPIIDHNMVADPRQWKKLESSNIAILWAFLIEQLFHSRLLDMRRIGIAISYPTHARGIIAAFQCMKKISQNICLFPFEGKISKQFYAISLQQKYLNNILTDNVMFAD